MVLRVAMRTDGGHSGAGSSSTDVLWWQPFFGGALAGCAMTIIGHPFDTLKVRMQTSAQPSIIECAKQTIKLEGASALYKGLPPALITTCLTSGLRFGVQHKFNDLLVQILQPTNKHDDAPRLLQRRSSASSPTISASFDNLTVTTRILAEGGGGAACGLVLPIVFTPLELVKVRRQILKDKSLSNWQIFKTVWRERGLSGLYTGHRLTVARSTFGNASLFGSFEAWKAFLRAPWVLGGGGEARPWSTSVIAGVLSGWTTQLVVFPIDAAKSRMQAATAHSSGEGGRALLPALAALWREGAMYTGVSSMLLRAVPVHLAYLPVYGLLMTMMRGAS